MKVLVITHGNNSIYGAATSLKLLLHKCGWDYDLVYLKHFKKKNQVSHADMRKYTNNTVRYLWDLYLPYARWAVLRESSIYIKIRALFLKPFIIFDLFRLRTIIEKEKYDYIVLNSLVLFPLIEKEHKYILFIREPCIASERQKKQISKKLNLADKIIYIDSALVSMINDVKCNSIVINNPFDMTDVKNVELSYVQERFSIIDHSKIVITIAGIISSPKGVDFVIEAFKCVKRDDIQLVIVGKGGDKKYSDHCKTIAQHDERIIFLGEQQDMKLVYRITDYIIRAEELFVTGRTVYEGLYSGCNVILQYNRNNDIEHMEEYSRFKEKITLYKARDKKSLCDVLEGLPSEKVVNREYLSNAEKYADEISKFISL